MLRATSTASGMRTPTVPAADHVACPQTPHAPSRASYSHVTATMDGFGRPNLACTLTFHAIDSHRAMFNLSWAHTLVGSYAGSLGAAPNQEAGKP